MEKNMRNIRNEFKKNGIFYTTTELAETLKRYVDYQPTAIYDPTCGQGNLLSVFDDDIPKYGQELFSEELEKASERLKNFTGYAGDTLKDDGFKNLKFDLIIANPPFSIKWEPDETDVRFKDAPCTAPPGKADYAFILHILHHLKDNGKAICLEFPGVLYRGQREGKIREWLVNNNWIERVVHIPGNTFVDTTIATCIVVFNKSKNTTDIVFEDRELQKERVVSIDEVINNGYALSVSNYIVQETQKEQINPIELAFVARKEFLDRLERELKFETTICQLEGLSINPFIEDIKRIIVKYVEKPVKPQATDSQMTIDEWLKGSKE